MRDKKIISEFPAYLVYENGDIFSTKTNKFLKPWEHAGYYYVTLRKDGKSYNKSVHRIVAKYFIPNLSNYPVVNHKDENKLNNDVSNLEWCTYRYNLMYGENAPSNNIKIAQELRNRRVIQFSLSGEKINEYLSLKEASKRTNTIYTSISKCCAGFYKTAGGFKWKYG